MADLQASKACLPHPWITILVAAGTDAIPIHKPDAQNRPLCHYSTLPSKRQYHELSPYFIAARQHTGIPGPASCSPSLIGTAKRAKYT